MQRPQQQLGYCGNIINFSELLTKSRLKPYFLKAFKTNSDTSTKKSAIVFPFLPSHPATYEATLQRKLKKTPTFQNPHYSNYIIFYYAIFFFFNFYIRSHFSYILPLFLGKQTREMGDPKPKNKKKLKVKPNSPTQKKNPETKTKISNSNII